MVDLSRRSVLSGIALTALTALTSTVSAAADTGPGSTPNGRLPAPAGLLDRLPGVGNQLALTVDDGTSAAVVAAFAQFCRDTGTRLTFFVNGANASWTGNAPVLRPMVDSGQIQLGNHTWSHPDITKISSAALADQIRRNGDFLRNTYGVDGTPYFRPPYGRHDARTDEVAAGLGYHTITTWSGTVGDSVPENEASLVGYAAGSFQAQQIILMHANLPTVTHCFGQLGDLIRTRNLQTVTLNDVFG